MSFSLTTDAMLKRQKTVTRRMGWASLKAGDVIMACEKCMGLKKGQKVRELYPIRILSVRLVPLDFITQDDVRREGFFAITPTQFIELFCASHKGCYPFTNVRRIEFEEVKS